MGVLNCSILIYFYAFAALPSWFALKAHAKMCVEKSASQKKKKKNHTLGIFWAMKINLYEFDYYSKKCDANLPLSELL